MTASAATIEFLDQLRFRGVEIWLEGERLRYSAPKGVLNDDVLNELRQQKEAIIDLLSAEKNAAAQGTQSITPIPRYYQLNHLMRDLRGGEFRTYIKGLDELQTSHDNVMLEACNTSF